MNFIIFFMQRRPGPPLTFQQTNYPNQQCCGSGGSKLNCLQGSGSLIFMKRFKEVGYFLIFINDVLPTYVTIKLSRQVRSLRTVLNWPSGSLIPDPKEIFRGHSQGCGSGSQLDPDSIASVDPDPYSESGYRRANDPQKQKKFQKFHVLKCWMFSFES